MRRSWLLGALGLLLTGCLGTKQIGPPPLQVTVHRLELDQTGFFDVAWLADGTLVLNQLSGLSSFLWQVHPNGSGLERLSLQSDPRCRVLNVGRPRTLPNGSLAFLRDCTLTGPEDKVDLSLIEYNSSTGQERPLMAQPLGVNPAEYTWNPQMTRGLYSVTSSICAGIGAMNRQRVVDFPLAIVVGGRSHQLDEDLLSPGSADCSNEIKADLPAWSPDGSQIAFLASPQVIGSGGFSRSDAPWNLYLVGADEEQPVPVLSGLVHPQSLFWSPDGKSLAYAGEVEGRGEGVWLFNVATRELRTLVAGRYMALAWSHDGSQVAVVRDLGPVGAFPPNTEVDLLNLSPSTSPSEAAP